MKINNYKVAPFRKYSRGYTGQNRVALRSNLKFNLDDLFQVRILSCGCNYYRRSKD